MLINLHRRGVRSLSAFSALQDHIDPHRTDEPPDSSEKWDISFGTKIDHQASVSLRFVANRQTTPLRHTE